MSGPIVRSGPSATYTENWDQVFGKKKSARSESSGAATKKSAQKKTAKKKAAKKSSK